MVTRIIILFLLFLPFSSMAQEPPLSAYVDRTEVSLNDVFILTIRMNSELGTDLPALGALDQSFEQLGMSRSSSFTIINNVSESWNEYRISLRAKTTGSITIPAFRIGAQTTQPIAIEVSDLAQTSGNNEDFFLTTTLDKESVYVQEEILYTVRIYFSSPFDQGAQLGNPEAEGAVIQQLGNDSSYQEIINGLRYNVIERRFLIYPQSSGTLSIKPISFNATVGRRRVGGIFSSRTSGGRIVSLQGEEHNIAVKSKPASFPPNATWLPSSKLELEESWSNDLQNIEIGDAVTRNLRIEAEGLSSSLIPNIVYEETEGLKFYPDQANREDMATQDGVIGVRSQGTAIVASEAGDFTIPEIVLPWWNTNTDTLEYARLPQRTLTIAGTLDSTINNSSNVSPGSTSSNINIAQATDISADISPTNIYWQTLSALLAFACIITTSLWLKSRSLLLETSNSNKSAKNTLKKNTNSKTSVSTASAFGVFKFACQENDLAKIRQTLLSWARTYYQDQTIQSLEKLKQYITDAETQNIIAELESILYGTNGDTGNFDSKSLLSKINQLNKKEVPQEKKDKPSYSLPPLYKN